MSIHAVPGRMASRSPSGPSTTSRTWGGPGSEVTTASVSAAAAAGVCAQAAPFSTTRAARSRTRS